MNNFSGRSGSNDMDEESKSAYENAKGFVRAAMVVFGMYLAIQLCGWQFP